jgi:YbbR domain-containing protein
VLARVYTFFTENWGLKLAALGLAVLLWMSVTANEPERAEFQNIPIAVELQDPGWRLDGPPQPENMTVVVEGPRASLVELSSQSLRIVLPVERVTDTIQSHVVPLQSAQQQIPAHLRQVIVRSLRPDTIMLRFERLASRTVPVQVRLSGRLPAGLALAIPINTNPGAVEVRGPASELAGLDSVPLFPVELTGLRSTTNIPVSVDTTLLRGLSFEPREVNVVLRVTPDTVADTASVRAGAPF